MEKGEVIPDNTVPKSNHRLFVENYYGAPQYEFEEPTVKAEKIVSRKVLSHASSTADKYFNSQEHSQEIKVKLNESRLPISTKLNNWKKIQLENSAEKITLQKTRN